MTIRIEGYPATTSLRAGGSLAFMLSAEGAPTATTDIEIVRLIHGDEHPDGPGFVEESVADFPRRAITVAHQKTQLGNFLTASLPKAIPADHGLTLHAFVYPTLFGTEQMILSAEGVALGIAADGRLFGRMGATEITLRKPLMARMWYGVTLSYDAVRGTLHLSQFAHVTRYNALLSKIVPMDYADTALVMGVPACAGIAGEVVIGAATQGDAKVALYNGKIDRPLILPRACTAAEIAGFTNGLSPLQGGEVGCFWDTSAGYGPNGIGDSVTDLGPMAAHAIGHNTPVRGQTGFNWNGKADCYHLAPQEYGGIECHADAITDCAWDVSLTVDIPATWRAGIYALKLHGALGYDDNYLPFVLRAAAPTAKVCFLVPTASYLAYANCRSHLEGDVSQVVLARVCVVHNEDLAHLENGQKFGLSSYDHHADGAGVCYSSARRPQFTMHPKYRVPGVDCAWQFPADLSIIAWLEHAGYDYDVLTDEDLDREGPAALAPYKTVINGTHAEYYSERMLDATEDYLAAGGHLLYLSGNGYYWVVAFRQDRPGLMEIRKLDSGSRAWQARPGEAYLATTGERGGIWRHRGRAPQKLVGTGFASEGMDTSVGYIRSEHSHDPDVAWIFDGVAGDTIGNFGLAHGGAVGLEIDRYDRSLGTPPHTKILASSEQLTQNWQVVTEDVMFMYPGLGGDQHADVRCDMTYFTTQNGGAVFSPSSIAWGSALPCNGFDNDVARIMKNVVDRFIAD